MSSKLSDLDFQRLQETLLELKTRNYTLEDQAKKQRSALGDATARVNVLQQELAKANKTIDKSKKLTEVQKILNENESLQRKLLSQEDEFRLQNQTLLNELTVLVNTNERLEAQLGTGNGKPTETIKNEETAEKIENLQEKLKTFEEEDKKSKKRISELEGEVSELKKKELDKLTDEFSMEETGPSENLRKEFEKKTSEIEDLKIELEGQKAEKKLMKQHNEELKQQLNQIENEKKLLKEELSNYEEKLKKKQATLKEVQLEKETLINEFKSRSEEKEKKFAEESKQLEDQNQRLQTQLNKSQTNYSEMKEQFTNDSNVLKNKIENLEIICVKFSEDNFKELEAKNMCLQNEVEKVEIEKEKISLSLEKLNIDFEKLSIDYTILKSTAEESAKSNESLTAELEALKKISEKRKLLIDEMAIEVQQKIDEQQQSTAQYNTSLNQLSEQKTQEILHLELQIQGLQDKINDLEVWPRKCDELSDSVENLKEAKASLEIELEDLKNLLRKEEEKYQKSVKDLKESFLQEKNDMVEEFEKKSRDFEMQLELVNVQKCEFEEDVAKLQQDIKDGIEDRKISEKKGHSLIKDLKRQLQSEKNRNEKLQEKMKECFETTSNFSDPSRDLEADRTSVSSWSLMSGQNDRDTSTPNPLSSSPFPSSNGIVSDNSPVECLQNLTQENEMLMAKVAKLMEEKSDLEERLAMLEQSGAGMADEIVAKSKLIQQYCMEAGSRRGSTMANRSSLPTTPSGDKMRNFVDKIDKFVHLDSQREAHSQEVSNMQKMLEETLTKNMHLQQDLDNMSQELVRLSKLAVGSN